MFGLDPRMTVEREAHLAKKAIDESIVIQLYKNP